MKLRMTIADLPRAIFSFCWCTYLSICSSARPLVRNPPTHSTGRLFIPRIIIISLNHFFSPAGLFLHNKHQCQSFIFTFLSSAFTNRKKIIQQHSTLCLQSGCIVGLTCAMHDSRLTWYCVHVIPTLPGSFARM